MQPACAQPGDPTAGRAHGQSRRGRAAAGAWELGPVWAPVTESKRSVAFSSHLICFLCVQLRVLCRGCPLSSRPKNCQEEQLVLSLNVGAHSGDKLVPVTGSRGPGKPQASRRPRSVGADGDTAAPAGRLVSAGRSPGALGFSYPRTFYIAESGFPVLWLSVLLCPLGSSRNLFCKVRENEGHILHPRRLARTFICCRILLLAGDLSEFK